MAGRLNLTIEQGTDWERRFVWKGPDQVAIDTTGYEAVAQIRETLESATVILELSTTNGRIEVGLTDPDYFSGAVHTRLVLTSVETADLPQRGQATYDLLLTSPGGSAKRLLQGSVFWSGAVTRP